MFIYNLLHSNLTNLQNQITRIFQRIKWRYFSISPSKYIYSSQWNMDFHNPRHVHHIPLKIMTRELNTYFKNLVSINKNISNNNHLTSLNHLHIRRNNLRNSKIVPLFDDNLSKIIWKLHHHFPLIRSILHQESNIRHIAEGVVRKRDGIHPTRIQLARY